MYEVDQIRRTSRSFLEASNMCLENINVIGTCGLYTIGSSSIYYVPYYDTTINDFEIVREYDSHYVCEINSHRCVIIKNGVDHALFGEEIGIIYDNEIKFIHAYFSSDTMNDRSWEISGNVAVYIDNRTKNYTDTKNISLRNALFKEAIFVGKKFGKYEKNKYNQYTFSEIDEDTLVVSNDGSTITDFNKFNCSAKKLIFNGCLRFHY